MNEEEKLNVHYIPKNFVDKGRILNGMFKTRNFVEGCIITLPVAVLIFFLTNGMPTNWRIVVVASPSVCLFMVAALGINGDSLFEFAAHVMEFNRNRRVARYNNRVKHEAVPEYIFKTKAVTPFGDFAERFRNMVMGDESEEYSADDIYGENMDNIVFEDDIGVAGVIVPKQFKTKKEIREEEKLKKKMLKEARRIRTAREKHDFLVEQEAEKLLKEYEQQAKELSTGKRKGRAKR